MAEKHYAFIKNNAVENISVFAEKDDVLAQQIVDENKYDSFVWLNDAETPARWSTWNGTEFTPPTLDYLYSIGVSNENQAMHDARIAEAAAKAAENATPTA